MKIIHVCFLILFFLLGIYLSLTFYIIQHAEKDSKKHTDVILVLGTKAYHDDIYNPCLIARVKHAVELYKEKYAPKLLFSGGINHGNNVNESQVMKEIAMSLGVPQEDILLESVSTSTYENMLFSKKLLVEKNMDHILLVTEPFHLPRAILVARKLGLKVIGSPAVKSCCWSNNKYLSRYFIKEPLAIMFYKLKGRI